LKSFVWSGVTKVVSKNCSNFNFVIVVVWKCFYDSKTRSHFLIEKNCWVGFIFLLEFWECNSPRLWSFLMELKNHCLVNLSTGVAQYSLDKVMRVRRGIFRFRQCDKNTLKILIPNWHEKWTTILLSFVRPHSKTSLAGSHMREKSQHL
jgi:hypothetical protein